MEENKKTVATEEQTRVQLEKTYKDEKLGFEVTISLKAEDCHNLDELALITSSYSAISRKFYFDFYRAFSPEFSQ